MKKEEDISHDEAMNEVCCLLGALRGDFTKEEYSKMAKIGLHLKSQYEQLSETEEKLKRAYTEIVENWKQASGGCDDLYCVYCFWDEYDNKHEKDCIVLEAQAWLEDKE